MSLLPPTGFAPRSLLDESPARRFEQLKSLLDAGVISKEQALKLFDEEPKCEHGVRTVDCEEPQCVVDWVHSR